MNSKKSVLVWFHPHFLNFSTTVILYSMEIKIVTNWFVFVRSILGASCSSVGMVKLYKENTKLSIIWSSIWANINGKIVLSKCNSSLITSGTASCSVTVDTSMRSGSFVDFIINFRESFLAFQTVSHFFIQLVVKHLAELFRSSVWVCIKHLETETERLLYLY